MPTSTLRNAVLRANRVRSEKAIATSDQGSTVKPWLPPIEST